MIVNGKSIPITHEESVHVWHTSLNGIELVIKCRYCSKPAAMVSGAFCDVRVNAATNRALAKEAEKVVGLEEAKREFKRKIMKKFGVEQDEDFKEPEATRKLVLDKDI